MNDDTAAAGRPVCAPRRPTRQITAGTVTIANQAYDTVEDIVLQISDASGRLSYSSVIQMQTRAAAIPPRTPETIETGATASFRCDVPTAPIHHVPRARITSHA